MELSFLRLGLDAGGACNSLFSSCFFARSPQQVYGNIAYAQNKGKPTDTWQQRVNTTQSIRGLFHDKSLLKIQSVQKVTPVGGVCSPQVLRKGFWSARVVSGWSFQDRWPVEGVLLGAQDLAGVRAKRVTIDGAHGGSVSSSLVTMMMASRGYRVANERTASHVC